MRRYINNTDARQYVLHSKHRRFWNKTVFAMIIVVVFATTYMLILPAITMEKNAFCGTEEHLHDPECFEKQLICGYELEGPHVHTAECYEEHQVLICDKAEIQPHTHDESCVQQEFTLVCTEDHEHTDECSQVTESYFCGMDEIGHSHGSECYETQEILICDFPENSEGHIHSDECYEEALICTRPEHEHGLSCYSNPNADVETPSVWESSLSNVELTGIWADDVVAIAQSQIGYTESTQNYIVTDAGVMKGYSRYGAWYGDPYGDWCAMFASFSLHYAGVEGYPLDANCQNWMETLSQVPYQSYDTAENYKPQPGDLIFFNTDDQEGADHIGIVAEYAEETDAASAQVKIIEGNSANCVRYVTYAADDPTILGYGKLPENPAMNARTDCFSLTAVSAEGQQVTMTGPNASLPFPAEEISITVEAVINENAEALLNAAVADTELENGRICLFDVRLWHNGEEIEPIGPVTLTFAGVANVDHPAGAVFHVDEAAEQTTDMHAEIDEDGGITFDTDHFSIYGVVITGGGNVIISQNVQAGWNGSALSSLVFSVSSATDKMIYRVEYSDDGGSTWTTAVTSAQTAKNTTATLNAASALADAPLNRVFRVYGVKDSKNYGYNAALTLYDLLDSVKPGFSGWLENSYVQDFGGAALPATTAELYEAFALYDSLPTLTVSTRMDGTTMWIDAQTDGAGTYRYLWEYQDKDGTWQPLCEDETPVINASAIDLLLDGGKDVRCRLYEGGQLCAVSNIVFVDPMREIYDAAIAQINRQMGWTGTDYEIGGHVFNDLFFYGNVARDDRVPFNNASEYADYLAKLYLDNGANAAALVKVQAAWDFYLYDLYDPEYRDMGNQQANYPNLTVGDCGLGWPKSVYSSFHSTDTVPPVIDQLDYSFLENGIDYSNFISNLEKTATARAAGDANTERKYDVDIAADGTAKANGPVAMILQIQTSWQMFDLEHANAQSDDGATVNGSSSVNSELGTLYDIKHALLRFVDYMEERYPGNNLVLGITEVKHGGSQTMFLGTDNNGAAMYVSNNYDILRQAILQWDTFGNCEHVHYDTKMLSNAISALPSNLQGWEDLYNVPLTLDRIRKIGIIIGGPTENTPKENGYGCILPWSNFANLDSVYGIRTNVGTSYSGGYISWLENPNNNGGTPFANGAGNEFTQKYVASTEDAIYETLVRIAKQEMKKNMIDLTNPGVQNTYVEEVVVTDTVAREFSVDMTEPITATIYNKDGSVETTVTIPLDDPNLTLQVNEDGTTTVSYNFGTVWNGQKAVLHFTVVAKEDYIGSNNVFTNVGTPTAAYVHNKEDGTVEHYEVDCIDTPQVNVPIRFRTVDGETADILVSENVDLKDLSTEIAKNAEDLVDNYGQINGTLSYTWVLPDGTEVSAGSVTVKNGSIRAQTFPDRSQIFEGIREGQYTGTLKVTFTPETADPKNPNFSDTTTAAPVNPQTETGNVWINVVDENGEVSLIVKKEWPQGNGINARVQFYLLANGARVKDASGKDLVYTLTAADGWEMTVSGLPTVKQDATGNTTILQYSVEEVVPPGYTVSYEQTQRTTDTYGAKAVISFTPTESIDANKSLTIWYYDDYGEYEYTITQNAHEKFNKNTTYYFTIDDLPLGADGQLPEYDIWYVQVNGKNFTNYSASIYTERVLTGSETTPVSIMRNTPISGTLPETEIPYSKTIDYLGDGVVNPDTEVGSTSSKNELYRLYLTAGGAVYSNPIDLVIVIDRSASMYKNSISDGVTRRDRAVADFLNGSGGDTGFIESFLSMNPGNKLSIVWFGGDTKEGAGPNYYLSELNESGVIQTWTSSVFAVDYSSDIQGLNENGTDYMAGLWEAANQLSDASVANDGNVKMMLFLTDGLPTFHVQTSAQPDAVAASYGDYLEWVNTGTPETLYRTGTGQSSYITDMTRTSTLASIEEFKRMFPDAVIGSVMFGSDSTEYIDQLAANGGSCYRTESSAALKEYVTKLVSGSAIQNLTIEDQLSQYVEWYAGCPDIKVTRTDIDGNTTVLWQSTGSASEGTIGSATEQNYLLQDGVSIPVVQDVTFTSAPDSGGIVRVTFNPALRVEGGTTYTVSYNIKTSDAARAEYVANIANGADGYDGCTGADGTDFAGNATSSGQPGFASNRAASVAYTYNGTSNTLDYAHPVVQVVNGGYELPKTGGTGSAYPVLCGMSLVVGALAFNYRLCSIRKKKRARH